MRKGWPAGLDWRRELDRRWVQLTLVAWVVLAAWYLSDRWGNVRWLALGDTDDNLRLAQVRALMAGQGWYDLRQYRLSPPAGFDIHWSRLVDLPIAGLILLFRPFTTDTWAERLACGIAPLIPLSIVLLGLGATLRRLVHPLAWPLSVGLLFGAAALTQMFMPERIDHHGWQLALLSLTVAGLCDPAPRRGGLTVGLASAASLAIGLELLPFAAMAGAITALRWVWDRAEAPRLSAYALSLGLGAGAGYVAFASEANRVLRCDALTPVWLSAVVAAAALMLLAGRLDPASRAVRAAAVAGAGAVVGVGFALLFPQCLGRPEQVSPELARSWLNNVREAKPLYSHPFRLAFPIAALPVAGLIGAVLAAARSWRAEGPSDRSVGWTAVALFTAFAVAMLAWQARSGPAAQLLAIPGAAALLWLLVPITLGSPHAVVRVFGTAGAALLASGAFAWMIVKYLPVDRPTPYQLRVNRAGARCNTIPAMAPLNRYPAQTVFTFNDLGPRLIVLTHHSAIAGPYHRNGASILDVQHAFRRSPAEARAIMRRRGATLLLVCPDMAESTNYRARAPRGFYARLARGERFNWLTQLPLPPRSPFRLFRID